MNKSAILCVDDETTILDSLKEQLRRRFGDQYHYESADSASDAWAVIDEMCEDGIEMLVIVSDWLMPGVKGDEFLAQVHQRFPKIVKVMLTGQADEAAIDRARRDANLHACLHKPWSEDDLVAVIASSMVEKGAAS